jgi:hypothetical protein
MWLSFFSIVMATSIALSVAAIVVQDEGQSDTLHS